jgi:putative heme iron utilization protein
MPDAFPKKFITGMVKHINEDHRAEMLQLAHGLAGATWADEAEATHADTHGLDLLLHAADREEPLRIPFDPPLEQPNQFRPMLIGMIGQARANLGIVEIGSPWRGSAE